jgi:hypothetical protein
MKKPIMVGAVCLALIGLVVGFSCYYAFLASPADPSSESADYSSPVSGSQLKINDLTAFSDGRVSFNVTLNDSESIFIEAVKVNGVSYSWLEGSLESATILKGQTKYWSKDVGVLDPNAEVDVVIQATPGGGGGITFVDEMPTPENPEVPAMLELPDYYYDYYSGVGLFESGVSVIATSQNPLIQLQRSDSPISYWALLQENMTDMARDRDFISIVISRGDRNTGGYTIQVENFSLSESPPGKLLFRVNFTDPGDDVIMSQALTNPLALVPIGYLSPGNYEVEVHIVQYILTYDEQGKPNYRSVIPLKEEVWTQTLTVTGS